MTATNPEQHARRLAAESLAAHDVTGWFERLYSAAERGEAVVPWDRGGPHPLLQQWASARRMSDGRALVVGAGLGEDAELVAGLGLATTAFDISATAIRAARERFPDSMVDLVVADLLDPPPAWRGAFDLVVESLTVQSLPRSARRGASDNVASFLAPGATLVVIAAALEDADPSAGPPWPLTRAEIGAFASGGLQEVRIEQVPSPHDRTWLWWLAEFRRPSPGPGGSSN